MKMGSIYFLVCLQAIISLCFGLTSEEIAMFKSRTYVNKNTGIQGEVNIQEYDENTLLITSNGIPDHATGKFDGSIERPNYIQEQAYSYLIPKVPEYTTGEPGCLPMGPVAIALNGVAIYNPYTLECCDAGEQELNLFDECWGHPSPHIYQYHYHTAPLCLLKNYCNQPSSIIAVAMDGFPIYGPFDEDGTELTPADLDECNGKETSDGSYRYHVTGDLPYFLNCYKGKTITQPGFKPECNCTEVTQEICEEFVNGLPNKAMRTRYKTLVNQRLGLQQDGHFTCCEEGDEDCSFAINVGTDIETATGIIEIKDIDDDNNSAVGLKMGNCAVFFVSIFTFLSALL